MNRAIFVSVAVCLLVAPAWTLPADKLVEGSDNASAKKPEENEVSNPINRDVEQIDNSKTNVDETTSSVMSQSVGTITKIGIDGPLKCRGMTCPEETQTCTWTSKSLKDGKNAEVNYKCKSKNGQILLDETRTEPLENITDFVGFDFSNFFKDMHEFMTKLFRLPLGEAR